MTKILGIKIGKNEIFYSLMKKNGDTTELIDSGKIIISQGQKIPELMATIKTEISGLIKKYTGINKVVYNIYYDHNKEGILRQILPLGVLNLCCSDENIETEEKTKRNIISRKFGGIDKAEILKSMDSCFPSMEYKNDNMRLIVALTTLGF